MLGIVLVVWWDYPVVCRVLAVVRASETNITRESESLYFHKCKADFTSVREV